MMESILGCDSGPREPNSKLTTSSKQPRLLISASSLTITPVLVFLGDWRVLRPLPCFPFHNGVNEITKLTFVAKKHPQIPGHSRAKTCGDRSQETGVDVLGTLGGFEYESE